MQPREHKAHKKPEQEIQINGQPINSFERQDSVTQVGGSWSATVSVGAAQEMEAKAGGISTVVTLIPTLQGYHRLVSFKVAVAAHIWRDEVASLSSSSFDRHIADLVSNGNFK